MVGPAVPLAVGPVRMGLMVGARDPRPRPRVAWIRQAPRAARPRRRGGL